MPTASPSPTAPLQHPFDLGHILEPHPGLEIGELERTAAGGWRCNVQPRGIQVFRLYACGDTPAEALRSALKRYLEATAQHAESPQDAARYGITALQLTPNPQYVARTAPRTASPQRRTNKPSLADLGL